MGGGGGGLSFPLRDSTPCRPKGSTLWYFLRNPFLTDRPENFLRVALAPIYTNFEGRARAEKTQFFGQNFPKSV